jgi:hypothetical protein
MILISQVNRAKNRQEHAEFLACERLTIAAMRIELANIRQAEKEPANMRKKWSFLTRLA